MARLFTEPKLIVASHNKGKLVEIADLLTRFEVETVGADALGLPEPEETGTTFIANAELKALAAAMTAGLPALSDDSGLAVDALDGAQRVAARDRLDVGAEAWLVGGSRLGDTVASADAIAPRHATSAELRASDSSCA